MQRYGVAALSRRPAQPSGLPGIASARASAVTSQWLSCQRTTPSSIRIACGDSWRTPVFSASRAEAGRAFWISISRALKSPALAAGQETFEFAEGGRRDRAGQAVLQDENPAGARRERGVDLFGSGQQLVARHGSSLLFIHRWLSRRPAPDGRGPLPASLNLNLPRRAPRPLARGGPSDSLRQQGTPPPPSPQATFRSIR